MIFWECMAFELKTCDLTSSFSLGSTYNFCHKSSKMISVLPQIPHASHTQQLILVSWCTQNSCVGSKFTLFHQGRHSFTSTEWSQQYGVHRNVNIVFRPNYLPRHTIIIKQVNHNLQITRLFDQCALLLLRSVSLRIYSSYVWLNVKY